MNVFIKQKHWGWAKLLTKILSDGQNSAILTL